uniref:hypothetical protein n=1 Tax=Amycolatopsis sp. CA-096443 TaxID=3239919 RepID=UPI003F4934CC
MTHPPGYRGAPPPNVPPRPGPGDRARQQTDPRLREVTLVIEDAAGNTWTTAGKLVPARRERSTAAKVAGWLTALVPATAGAAAAAWILTLLSGLAHDQSVPSTSPTPPRPQRA